jgi:hypothetical protein
VVIVNVVVVAHIYVGSIISADVAVGVAVTAHYATAAFSVVDVRKVHIARVAGTVVLVGNVRLYWCCVQLRCQSFNSGLCGCEQVLHRL